MKLFKEFYHANIAWNQQDNIKIEVTSGPPLNAPKKKKELQFKVTEVSLDENKALIASKAKVKKMKQYDKAWRPDFDKRGSAIGDYSMAWIDLYKVKGLDKIIGNVVKKYPDIKIVKLGGHTTRRGTVLHNNEFEAIGSSEAMNYLKKEYENAAKGFNDNWKKLVLVYSI